MLYHTHAFTHESLGDTQVPLIKTTVPSAPDQDHCVYGPRRPPKERAERSMSLRNSFSYSFSLLDYSCGRMIVCSSNDIDNND